MAENRLQLETKLDTINTTLDTKISSEAEKIEGISTTLAKLDKLDDITTILTTINETLKDDSYTKVDPEGTENPSEEGWYEKDSEGKYVLSTDTTVVEGKTYYIKSSDKGVNQIKSEIDEDNNLTITILKNGSYVDSTEVNIPTASIVKNAYFDAETNEIVLEFTNGQTMRFSLTNLLTGLLPMALGFSIPATSWVSSGDDYMADLTTAINYILSQIPVYTAVTPKGTESPVNEGWYEKDESGNYVLSTDTKVDTTKTYFTKSGKTLTGTYQFNLNADTDVQSILDKGTAKQFSLVTTKVGDTWKLYAVAKGGKLNSAVTFGCTMTTVTPSTVDMSIVGTPVYRSFETENWVITFSDGSSESKDIAFNY